MKDLYRRLRQAGFDKAFVQRNLLPDWWDDSLADVPANRAVAEATISRMLGFPVAVLRDHDQQLDIPAIAAFRLKRVTKTQPTEIAPAVLLAFQAARSILRVLKDTPPFEGLQTAEDVRSQLLHARQTINLKDLVDFSWSVGIPVFHIAELPAPSKKFAGMSIFCDDRPAIILASGRDAPPWIAYYVAHELGHILRGHVTAGSLPLVDGDLDGASDNAHEIEADQFACTVLTGEPSPQCDAIYGMTADKLVVAVNRAARTEHIDPGVHALVYGKSAARMGVAQNALKLMGLDRGARRIIATALQHHLPEELPEPTEKFISLTTTAA